MSVKIDRLAALIVVRDGKNSKVTDVVIRLPDVNKVVARATLAGKWTAEQAIAEFKRLPARFKTEADGYEVAKALGLAA